jgi:hypothetical protein
LIILTLVEHSLGEVEDYAVKFIDPQNCSTAPPTNITVNNIDATTATVSWVATVGAYNIRWRTTPWRCLANCYSSCRSELLYNYWTYRTNEL